MKLKNLVKVRDGKYLKNYELTYENRGGYEKIYEMVSLREIANQSKLGETCTGVSIVVIQDERLLLLREFRMALNREIINLPAGRMEKGENAVDCAKRELYEETGLTLNHIEEVLEPSFSAVTITDAKTQIVFGSASGEISNSHTSLNEQITARFYTREEVELLLRKEEFSSRAQIIAWMFANKKL